MAVTEKPWDGSAGRFQDAEYARSCVLDLADCSPAAKDKTAKERYKLPIKEPNGDLNVNALGTAAAALAGARSPIKACQAAKKNAAKKLMRAYAQARVDAPESLESLAGVPDADDKQGGSAA
jgi:hypothetical protein